MREETPAKLWHPERIGSWRYSPDDDGTSVAAVMRKVRFGDPATGWPGDERLALYAREHPAGTMWELQRLEADGEYRLVARSQPGVPFDERIIGYLVEHDRRRGYDPHLAVVTANELLDRRQAAAAAELDAETRARLRHALRGDL